MSWSRLTWRPLDAASLPSAAPLADLAAIFRSAVEEALSGARSAPVSIRAAEVAEVPTSAELPEGAVPLATVELVGAPRRLVLVATDVPAETPADAALDPTATGSLVLGAADAAVAAVASEGLGLGPTDEAAIAEDAELVALRLALESEGQELGGLVLVAEAAAVAELAAHVAALRSLATATEDAATTGNGLSEDPGTEEASTAEGPADRLTAGADPSRSVKAGAGLAAASSGGPEIQSVTFADLGPGGAPAPAADPVRSIDLLLGVQLQVSVEIGRTRLPIREVLGLAPGSIVELDKLAGEKADILVNGHLVAQGEVVVVDENFGVRITDVVSRQRRILSADGAA